MVVISVGVEVDEVGVEGDGAEAAVLAGVPGGVQNSSPGEKNLVVAVTQD